MNRNSDWRPRRFFLKGWQTREVRPVARFRRTVWETRHGQFWVQETPHTLAMFWNLDNAKAAAKRR